jgi:hypothetical protein
MAKSQLHINLAIKCPQCGILLDPYPAAPWERAIGIKKFIHPVGSMDNNYNTCTKEGEIIERLIYQEN